MTITLPFNLLYWVEAFRRDDLFVLPLGCFSVLTHHIEQLLEIAGLLPFCRWCSAWHCRCGCRRREHSGRGTSAMNRNRNRVVDWPNHCRRTRPSVLTFSAHGSRFFSSEPSIGVAIGFGTGGSFGSRGWLVSGGGSSSHASVADVGAGTCADAVQPNNPTIRQNADHSDRKRVLSPHDRALSATTVSRVQLVFTYSKYSCALAGATNDRFSLRAIASR